jgi:hypothetical protein
MPLILKCDSSTPIIHDYVDAIFNDSEQLLALNLSTLVVNREEDVRSRVDGEKQELGQSTSHEFLESWWEKGKVTVLEEVVSGRGGCRLCHSEFFHKVEYFLLHAD